MSRILTESISYVKFVSTFQVCHHLVQIELSISKVWIQLQGSLQISLSKFVATCIEENIIIGLKLNSECTDLRWPICLITCHMLYFSLPSNTITLTRVASALPIPHPNTYLQLTPTPLYHLIVESTHPNDNEPVLCCNGPQQGSGSS